MFAFYLLGIVIFGLLWLHYLAGLLGAPLAEAGGGAVALILSLVACALFLMLAYGRSRAVRGGARRSPLENTKKFHTKLVGVTHQNPDGSSRQRLIREHCRSGQPIIVRPEPTNRYDSSAVAAYVAAGSEEVQLGYFDERLAAELSRFIIKGGRVSAWVTEVTGGGAGKPSLGVNVEVMKSAE